MDMNGFSSQNQDQVSSYVAEIFMQLIWVGPIRISYLSLAYSVIEIIKLFFCAIIFNLLIFI